MNNKINHPIDDQTLGEMLKVRRAMINLMLECEDKLTKEENRELEKAYETYVRFLGKWLKRNGYINDDEK